MECPEDSASRGEGWGKGTLPLCFRLNKSDDGERRGRGVVEVHCDSRLLRATLLASEVSVSREGG